MRTGQLAPTELAALVDRLRQVGLSRYEASIYMGLLMDETAKISEISKRTGVPQPKAYQALDSLVGKGFCVVGPDAVNRYRALPPSIALADFMDSLLEAKRTAQTLVEELTSIQEDGRGQELWAPPIEIVKGSRQVNQMVLERVASARKEILFFAKVPVITSAEIADTLVGALGRKVAIQIVYEGEYLEDEAMAKRAAFYGSKGAVHRRVDELPTKMVVFDRQLVLTSISTERGEGFMALVLRHPGLVQHMLSSFEREWERGEEF
jgi:sugar-specific transcriptional regulator TrmB